MARKAPVDRQAQRDIARVKAFEAKVAAEGSGVPAAAAKAPAPSARRKAKSAATQVLLIAVTVYFRRGYSFFVSLVIGKQFCGFP